MGNKVPYPWLASQDLKRFQTDREVLEQLIDLSESSLTPSMKEEFYELLEEYKKYFSLYGEISLAQRMEINLEFTEINKLVILGIIKKDLSEVYSLEIVIRSLQPRNGYQKFTA